MRGREHHQLGLGRALNDHLFAQLRNSGRDELESGLVLDTLPAMLELLDLLLGILSIDCIRFLWRPFVLRAGQGTPDFFEDKAC